MEILVIIIGILMLKSYSSHKKRIRHEEEIAGINEKLEKKEIWVRVNKRKELYNQ